VELGPFEKITFFPPDPVIIQLSVQVIRMKLVASGSVTTKYRAQFVVDDNIFDSYVNPKVSPVLWDDHLIAVHGICPHDKRITRANEI
jgi:hypothetical protein